MKRFFLLFAVVLLASFGWSQTMNIEFKNGTTQKISMNDINAITFTQDDDEVGGVISKLVGTWDIVKDVYYKDGEAVETNDGNGAYWVFTEHTITVYDPYDLLNGNPVDYTVKDDKLHAAGIDVHTIVELTSSKLILRTMEILGTYDVITFKKR